MLYRWKACLHCWLYESHENISNNAQSMHRRELRRLQLQNFCKRFPCWFRREAYLRKNICDKIFSDFWGCDQKCFLLGFTLKLPASLRRLCNWWCSCFKWTEALCCDVAGHVCVIWSQIYFLSFCVIFVLQNTCSAKNTRSNLQ